MAEARNLPQTHLNAFINSVKKGYPVLYVEESSILAVDHPDLGYITLQLLDKIIDSEEE